jgi:hypothetical protein
MDLTAIDSELLEALAGEAAAEPPSDAVATPGAITLDTAPAEVAATAPVAVAPQAIGPSTAFPVFGPHHPGPDRSARGQASPAPAQLCLPPSLDAGGGRPADVPFEHAGVPQGDLSRKRKSHSGFAWSDLS